MDVGESKADDSKISSAGLDVMSGPRPHTHHRHTLDTSSVTTEEGIRAIKVSTFGLAATAAVQFGIVAIGGSVGLLADALHNLGDVFTTVGLWIAFNASRRAATRRYAYGYDRFEDLVGVVIVLIIAASAVIAGMESYDAIQSDHRVRAIPISIAAALVGVVGNELVARYKIQTGKRINSMALEADGKHSRTDGLVSAGAVAGLTGVALGYPIADAAAGLVITCSIAWITFNSARDVVGRLVDSIDPTIIDRIEAAAVSVEGVLEVHDVRARWAGRSLWVQLHVGVAEALPLHEAHAIGEQVRHAVFHDVEGVAQVGVHLDPWGGTHPSVYHSERPPDLSG